MTAIKDWLISFVISYSVFGSLDAATLKVNGYISISGNQGYDNNVPFRVQNVSITEWVSIPKP
ncbi:UNVERIFIED_CONTAM: hypothetical protein FKN15_002131 [Acipenser sinensis]